MISTLRSKRSWLRSALVYMLGAAVLGCTSEPPPAPAPPAAAPVDDDPAAKKKVRAGKEDPTSPNYAEKPGGGGAK